MAMVAAPIAIVTSYVLYQRCMDFLLGLACMQADICQ